MEFVIEIHGTGDTVPDPADVAGALAELMIVKQVTVRVQPVIFTDPEASFPNAVQPPAGMPPS